MYNRLSSVAEGSILIVAAAAVNTIQPGTVEPPHVTKAEAKKAVKLLRIAQNNPRNAEQLRHDCGRAADYIRANFTHIVCQD